MGTLNHLNKEASRVARLSDDERILWMRTSRWIGYPLAKQAIERLERLMHYPQKARMPNMLIVGDTNNGKTSIIDKFTTLHPRKIQTENSYVDVPILSIQAPPYPDEDALYMSILDTLFAVYKNSEKLSVKRNRVVSLLRKTNTKILIIDEIHSILAGHLEKQRQFLNVLKYLGNELRIPIVAVGTREALRAIQSDPQLANRFEPFPLTIWRPDRTLQQLLASYESILPLREPSHLSSSNMTRSLCALSEGLIGELNTLLEGLAELAIKSRTERITAELISNYDWVKPSQRRKLESLF